MEIQLEYVGKLTIKVVRDFILDKKLADRDTVVLNYINFDDLALEFRETYKQSLPEPYILLSVLVEQDFGSRIPSDRIGLILNDPRRPRQIRNAEDLKQSLLNSEEIIFRCGFCGDIVDPNGEELDNKAYVRHRQILETRKAKGFVREIVGYCCHDKYSKG
jgi:hypothetical protein